MEGEWPLVGRAAELDRVDRLLCRGSGGVVLAGPAGVGKTRLATECLRVAEGRGFVPIRVGATKAASSLPFGAFAPLLPEISPGSDRTEMLRQVSRAISERGAGKPIAVLVDDAHILDEGSAALTHQLATRDRTFVLATVRSGEPASDAVTALWKDGLAERLEVSPLARDQVDAVLAAVLGARADGATVHLLWERTQGNVLFLKEAILGALDAGILREEGGLWRLTGRLPHSVRLVEMIETRLAGLGEAERKALSIVAVGEPLGVDVFAGAAARARLDALERRALLRIDADGRRLQVRVAHPLYGDVLRARLSPLRTRELSRWLADAVEGTGARRREDVLRVAAWRLDAGGEVHPALMVAAGRQARALFEFDLAGRLVRAGIEGGAGFEAELFLGELLLVQGRVQEAEDILMSLAPRAGDDSARARVALIRIDGLHWTGRVEEATVVLERAEATVTEPAWRDELTFKRAQFAWYGGRTAEALALLEPLLDRLDGQALAVAHFIATYAFGQTGQTGAALAASDRGRAVHQTLTDIRFAWYPSVHSLARLRALVWAGRLGEAETLAARCYQEALAEEAEEPRSWFAWMLADCSRGQGRGETAIPWAREAVNIVRPLDRGIYFRNLLIVLAGSLVLAGKVDEAIQVISEIDGLSVPMIGWDEPDFIRVRAWVAVARGDVATAKVLLEEAAASAARTGDRVYESGALHDLVRLGHAADVVVRLRELAEIVEGPAARARAAHAEALVARDPAGLEAVSAAFEGMPAFLLAAEAAADAAVAWRKAGNPRKATAAEGRAHALAARCEGARTPALTAITARATLTPRELEIARLAAAGVDNKEIAGRLHLSRATVQNKLHAVYGKLGIAGRDELAHTLAQRQEGGLSPHP